MSEEKNTKPVHAKIRTWHKEKDYKFQMSKKEITVHLLEDEDMRSKNLIAIDFPDGPEYIISIDALFTVIYAAYAPSTLRTTIGFFERMWFGVRQKYTETLSKFKKFIA
jgi:hypothetical protein